MKFCGPAAREFSCQIATGRVPMLRSAEVIFPSFLKCKFGEGREGGLPSYARTILSDSTLRMPVSLC